MYSNKVSTDPDGGLVRPDRLLLPEPEDDTLVGGIPRAIDKRTKTILPSTWARPKRTIIF